MLFGVRSAFKSGALTRVDGMAFLADSLKNGGSYIYVMEFTKGNIYVGLPQLS
jgi:hypothetical protein